MLPYERSNSFLPGLYSQLGVGRGAVSWGPAASIGRGDKSTLGSAVIPDSFRLCQDNSSVAAAHRSQSPQASPENRDRNYSVGVKDRNYSVDVEDRNYSMDGKGRNDLMDVKPECLKSVYIPVCLSTSSSRCKNLERVIFTPMYFPLNIW